MNRNFGMKSARQPAGGAADHRALRADTLRDPFDFRENYPLPPGTLRADPMTDAERSSAAGKFVIMFLSLWLLIPWVVAGIMLHFR